MARPRDGTGMGLSSLDALAAPLAGGGARDVLWHFAIARALSALIF